MGRYLLTIGLICSSIYYSYAQCPDLPSNTMVNGSSMTSLDLCGAQSVTFTVEDTNLPPGTIDWYSGSAPGFDPLSGGTLEGSSIVTSDLSECSTCPAIEALFIDVCNDLTFSEDDNEFAIVSSGSGFTIDNFSFQFPNPGFGTVDSDINAGDVCGWTDGDASLITGCTDVVSVGPGDAIPPNSILIVQTSVTALMAYDLSSICGLTDCIYVVKNACDRSSAGFKNCDAGGGIRTVGVSLTCGCNNMLTYDIANICSGGGGGTFYTDEGFVGNNGCTTGPDIIMPSPVSHNSTVAPFNFAFTDDDCNSSIYFVGVLNSDLYNDECCGPLAGQTEEFEFNISCASAEMTQDGDGDLCPGECETYSFNFTGGEAPYSLEITLTTSILPINITLPGFEVGDQLTICYDNGGPLFDPNTFTLDVPGGIEFSGTLTLNSFTDNNGCAGTVTGTSLNLSFNNALDAITPPTQTACDLGTGLGIFILSDIANIINGGSGDPVNFYSDPDGTIPILSDPFDSGTTTIYGQIDGDPCDSELVPIDLLLITNGDAGVVTFFCDEDMGPSEDCAICDEDNTLGEQITLSLFFGDPSIDYDYEIEVVDEDGTTTLLSGTAFNGMTTINFDVFNTTTFTVVSVTAAGDCADLTDLGSVITITYGQQPQMDDPGTLTNCGPVTLPPITGNLVPADAGYYTGQFASGTKYIEGDMITTSQTLYIYAGIDGCDQEIEVDVIIQPNAEIDDIDDVITCGQYILPEITGTNVDNATYFTDSQGAGAMLAEGQTISGSLTLFIFDPVCGGDEEMFSITITPGPVFTNSSDTIVCDTFFIEPISGMDLTGNEAYYEFADGTGQIISIGDTITSDTTIYIYDNTPGCLVESPITITINTISNPGEDNSISICEGDNTSYNLMEQLGGGTVDEGGVWIEATTSIVSDSSAVDFSALGIGQYEFEYMISDTICGDTSSNLTVNIVGNIDAGEDFTLAVCKDTTVNIFTLIDNPDESGFFEDEDGLPATFDPSNATFLADGSGLQIFNYVIGDPNSSCGADTSIFSVISNAIVDAGEDNTESLCIGQQLDITSLLSGNSSTGTFSEPVFSGGLVGTTFDSNLVPDGDYIIYHIVNGLGPCPNDTATFTITVRDEANAGDEMTISLCGAISVDLADEINGDSGGTFYQGGTMLSSSIVNFTNETGAIEFLYIVGNGVECIDTAVLTVVRSIIPPNSIQIDNQEICSGECATVEIGVANNGGQTITIYYHIIGTDGQLFSDSNTFIDFTPNATIELCEGMGSLASNIVTAGESYEIILDSLIVEEFGASCFFLLSESVSLTVNENTTSQLEGPRCSDFSITIGSDTYDIDNQSGSTTIPGGASNGCDSTVLVDLIFLNEVPGEYTNQLCTGDTDTVLGITYSTTTLFDTLLVGASTSGCDSLLTVNLMFFDNEMESQTPTICSGDTITIAGQDFFLGNDSDVIQVPGGAANGCDLIIDVQVTVELEAVSVIEGQRCTNASEIINGETFNVDNPAGIQTILNGAVNGCDSTIFIDLDFSLASIDSSIIMSTCDNSFFFLKGGITFNRFNPSGTATEPSVDGGCDTLFTVDITYGEMEINYTEIDGTCMLPDSGIVVFEMISGVAPFDVIYNGNNAKGFVFPFEIMLPAGNGEILVTDATGCMETIPYTIQEGEGGDFNINQFGTQLSLTGGIPDSILWSPTDFLSCIDCIDPMASPDVTTLYTAIVFYGGDCIDTLEFLVEVDDNIDDYIVPNVISPNGDNQNENFTLFITEGAIGTPLSMSIYDRWGNLVFDQNDSSLITTEGWNGRMNNTAVTSGVYVYRIAIQEGEKIINLYGDLTVIR